MMRIKFIDTVSKIKSRNILLKSDAISHVYSTSKCNISLGRSHANKKVELDDLDKPIKYSTSPLPSYRIGYKYRMADIPEYQGIIVASSLAIVLIYFGILREENDIDQLILDGMDPAVKEYLYGIKPVQKEESKNTSK